MGLNNEFGAPICFDLESIAHERAAEFLPPPELEFLTPPKNYSKPESIEKWKMEERLKRLKGYEDDLEKCSLDPDLNRIVALGWMLPSQDEPEVRACADEQDEKTVLAEFWSHVANGALLIGFNCVAFDVPTLLRRSLLLGVRPPMMTLSKYRHPGVVDIMGVLNFDGMLTWRSQQFYLSRFGLDVPKDEHTGEDIALLYHEENWNAIRHHCRCDVLGVRALARFIGLVGER